MTSVLAALQSSVVIPLVATIPSLFDVSAADASWIVISTLLGGSISAPILSRLADMYGKRRILVLTLIAVGIGSLLVAVSDVFLIAVLGRTIQGCAMALTPIAFSIIKDVLPAHQVGLGIAVLSGTLSLGSAVGLPVAGVLHATWGWHALFWVSVILAPLLALLAWLILPRDAVETKTRFDPLGAILLVLIVAPTLLVISQANAWGWTSPWVLGGIAIAALSATAWIPWSLRREHPIVDIRVAVSRPIVLTNIATFILSAGMLANLYLASQQLGVPRDVPGGMGLVAAQVGILMAIPAAVLLVLTPVIGPMLNRWGGRFVMFLGAVIMAVGYVARIWLDGSPFAVTVGTTLVSVGIALGLTAQPMIIMGVVPLSETASANGVNSLFRSLGTSVAIAAIAAVTSATSVAVDGIEHATRQTFHTAFIGFAVAMAVAAVLTLAIPQSENGLRNPVRSNSLVRKTRRSQS
ncbi:MFS transporter [Microbacterium sp.]|uniref:MFS transporter n=1 Tax=Microbacterium sp. TaxID=51671 RepID=UPI002735BC6C|nr:MFS transporter [Microbacterium sp.]MDP3950427.1 MFS transporter [Microbacterium sp.]